MPPPTRRPLLLHVSALSNAEYDTYTSSLAELTSPMPNVDWEEITMGVREARGWIRGRYGVDGTIIDQILRYFCPELGPHDMLTGGQFFAALRLVSHAQTGVTVDENLVFVQANPDPAAPRSPSPHKAPPLSRTPSAKSAPPPPPRPSPEGGTTPSLPPRTAPPVPSPNPFHRTKSHTQHDKDKEKPVDHEQPLSSNPFRRSSSAKPPPSVSSASSSSSAQYVHTSPPLPPRKPAATLLPPPRHASLAASKAPLTSSKASTLSTSPLPTFAPPVPTPPIKPPKPPHATSPLIKQSLQAAKGAQSAQAMREGLSKERRWEVIKKSGSGANGGGGGSESGSASGSAGGSKHGSEERREAPPSPPQSFYDVAAARIGSSPISSAPSSVGSDHTPGRDTGTPGHDQPASARQPFSHTVVTNTPPSPSSPTGFNPRRSKSLHHPSPGSSPTYGHTHTPPAPPPRRKRPESVQVTPSGASTMSPFSDSTDAPNGRGSPSLNGAHVRSTSSPLSRHLSFQASDSVMDTLHRTFENLRPGAGFESARIKAEGRVWPGGYVKGLARSREGARPLVDGEDGEDGFGQDRDVEEEEEELGRDADMGRRRSQMERDDLKMPVRPGEGWAALG